MGYNNECIPNIESLPREYFCTVCRLLVDPNEAVQSMCTHLYCKPCLAYVTSTTKACPYDGYLVTETDSKPLVESNKVLADTIGKTVVQCLFKSTGCTWLGSFSASSSHCSTCAFGSSLVLCTYCGIHMAHRQANEHIQACPGVQQWYQPEYQQYYQDYSGYYIYPQHQAPYVQPGFYYVAQSQFQAQAQPQLQSGSLVMHQPHVVLPFAPPTEADLLAQSYASMLPHWQDPSHTLPVYQGLQNLQAQAYPQPTPLSQAHHLHNAQVPQYQQLHGQTNSQLHIQNPLPPQQLSVPKQSTNTEYRKQLVRIYGGVPDTHPEQQPLSPSLPQQHTIAPTTDVVVQNPMMHQGGHFNHHPDTALQGGSVQTAPILKDVKHADSTILNGREAGSTSDSTNTINGVKHAVEVTTTKFPLDPKGKRIDASAGFDQRYNAVVKCNERKHGPLGKQVKEENGLTKQGKSLLVEKICTEVGPSLNGTSMEVADKSRQLVGTLDKNKELYQVSHGGIFAKNYPLVQPENQPGSQQQMHAPRNPPTVLRPHGLELSSHTSSGHAAALPSEKGLRADHESKGSYDNLHPSQVSNSIPKPLALRLGDEGFRPFSDEQMDISSLNPSELKILEERLKQYLLRNSNVDNNVLLRSVASSSGSLDRGIDQRLPLNPHENSRPTSRSSQPINDLEDRKFVRELSLESLVSKYLGMLSHGTRPLDHRMRGDRVRTDDTEGRYRLGVPRNLEFEGHGNLQKRERLQDSEITGPNDVPNQLRGGDFSSPARLKEGIDLDRSVQRPGDIGFRSRHTLKGFPSDGESFPGDVEPFQNSRKRAAWDAPPWWCSICKVDCETLEGLHLHYQTKEHQHKSMDMGFMMNPNAKKLKISHGETSAFRISNNMIKKEDPEVYDRKKKKHIIL